MTVISRRSLLKGVVGMTAAGVLLPSEEMVRRFYRLDRTMLAAPPMFRAGDRITVDVIGTMPLGLYPVVEIIGPAETGWPGDNQPIDHIWVARLRDGHLNYVCQLPGEEMFISSVPVTEERYVHLQ